MIPIHTPPKIAGTLIKLIHPIKVPMNNNPKPIFLLSVINFIPLHKILQTKLWDTFT